MHDEFVEGPGGVAYVERRVTGSASTKAYRCPGCDQEIRIGTPHVVAWPVAELGARRHWHAACWARRDTRRPGVVRSRNAPRR
ncbi:MAG TPA: ATP/GTP-binding protein [Mycobacteriales bacterium]|nr:ATP/GTP-binding protein [Mycobacteriales bacterium]